MDIKELGSNLESAINVMGNDENMKSLVDDMLNMHRTLNQSFTGKFIVNFIRRMALNYKNNNYDGRNETSCKICNTMWESLKKEWDWLKDDEDFGLALI